MRENRKQKQEMKKKGTNIDKNESKPETLFDRQPKNMIKESPEWLQRKPVLSTPLKKIKTEESAQPLSIIPHGVPLKRGFPHINKPKLPVRKLQTPTKSSSPSALNSDEINLKIEKALGFEMPKDTKLLHGHQSSQFESSNALVISMLDDILFLMQYKIYLVNIDKIWKS